MKYFVVLFKELDQIIKINIKVKVLVDYFVKVDDKDRMWIMVILFYCCFKCIVIIILFW